MSFKSIFEKYDVYKECPYCKNKSLIELEEGLFVCDSCGKEYKGSLDEGVLNEGPGAGYTISGTVTNPVINKLDLNSGDCDIDIKLSDLAFYSYYYGDELDFDVSAKITNIQVEEKDASEEDVLSELNGLKFEEVLGGGWSHATFDGQFEAEPNESYYPYIISVFIQISSEDVIKYIDGAVQGENEETQYTVLDGDDVVDFTDTVEDAIEIAEKENATTVQEVFTTYTLIGENGDIEVKDYQYGDVVWTNDKNESLEERNLTKAERHNRDMDKIFDRKKKIDDAMKKYLIDKGVSEDEVEKLYQEDKLDIKLREIGEHDNFFQQLKSESLNEKLVDVSEEELTDLESIFTKHGFSVDKRGKTLFDDIHYQIRDNSGTHLDIEDTEGLREFVSPLVDDIDKFDNEHNTPITWNFGLDKNGVLTGGVDVRKKYVKDEVEEQKNDNEALKEDVNSFSGKTLKDFLRTVDHRVRINLNSEGRYDNVGNTGGNIGGLNGRAHDVPWYLADKKIISITEPEDKKYYDYEILIEGADNSLKESVDDVYKDFESISEYLNKNNFTNFDLSDYKEGPLGVSKIVFDIEGDWKHDHLRFDSLVDEWAEENGRKIVNKYSEEVGESDSDYYEALHTVFLAKDDESYETLNSLRPFFNESLDEDSKDFKTAILNRKKVYIEDELASKTSSNKIKDAYDENNLSIVSNGSAYWFEHCPKGLVKVVVKEMKKYFPDLKYAFEDLKEDTIKQNGKWVNKGKEGTHGTFKTKKAADAQRKAMFAQGFKEELEESVDYDYEDFHKKWVEDKQVKEDTNMDDRTEENIKDFVNYYKKIRGLDDSFELTKDTVDEWAFKQACIHLGWNYDSAKAIILKEEWEPYED